MSANAFSSTSESAPSAASRLSSSPFSPHASAFGPTANMSLSPSNRTYGNASDRQSLSSRASSFTSSAFDHASTAGSKDGSAATSDQASASNVPRSTSVGLEEAPPASFNLQNNFSDRFRNSSDHSRNSSTGANSNLSVNSAVAAAASSRRSQSPFAANSANTLSRPSQSSGLSARSPTSDISPHTSEEHAEASSSFGAHSNYPSLVVPGGANGGATPSFGRQSFSDGPPVPLAHLLSSDVASTSITRSGSFSGTFPDAADDGLLSDPAYYPAHDLIEPQVTADTAHTPTSGPLSASDPRTQLLVSNLPYRVRWQDLKDLFRKAGTVLRADVSLSPDNRSRGYGTVLMATEQDAIKASDMLGGFTWQGRTLDVRIDRSGALLGVAGSAVLPTMVPHGPAGGVAASMPSGQPTPSPAPFSLAQTGAAQQFLSVPGGTFGASKGHMPGSLSGTASPSPLSSHASAAGHPRVMSSRAAFPTHSDVERESAGGNPPSEFERAMLQGQGLSRASSNGTPDRQRSHPNFEPAFAGLPQHRAVSAAQSLASNPIGPRRGSEVAMGSGGISQSGVWGPSITDAATSMYAPNAGGSSVPTGFPGATAMAPWPAGPGSFGGPAVASMQSQPFNSQMPTTSYAGRVLFVGNLPFHCQWQDLKDLFRAAGNIQRADVAIGPDGRSRGFGTVLFSSQEDAQNAVRLYHGYEYSGRTLKVHFDRFAAQNGPAVGTPGNPAQYTGAFAAAALPSHMTNNARAPPMAPQAQQQQGIQGGFVQQQYPHLQQQQQQQNGNSAPLHFQSQQPQQQGQGSFGAAAYHQPNPASFQFSSQYQPSLQMRQQPSLQQQQQRYGQQFRQPQQGTPSFSAFAESGRSTQAPPSDTSFSSFGVEGSFAPDRRSSIAQPLGLYAQSDEEAENESARDREHGMSIAMPANDFGAASSYLPSDLMSPGLASPPVPSQYEQTPGSHPGRIQLPSSAFANSFGAAIGGAPAGQMSPMTARMQVPMTPGMPGFTFHQVPETSPLYPQFLSPGLDPFSPATGGSLQVGGSEYVSQDAVSGAATSVSTGLTPGAPIGYNPMFAMTGGFGGSYGSNQQQQPPATPHWSQTSGPRRGGGFGSIAAPRRSIVAHNPDADEVVDGDRLGIAKTPGAGPRRSSHVDVGGPPLAARRASDGTPAAVEPSMEEGYPFPTVASGNASHLTRRASMDSPAQTPLAGPTGSTSSAKNGINEGSAGSGALSGDVLAGTSAEELANTIARLSVKGTALARDSNSRRSVSMTAERTAAASAMAKLRGQAGTPTTPPAEEGGASALDTDAAGLKGLGAAFAESTQTQQQPPRLGLAGRFHSNPNNKTKESSPLGQVEPRMERVFGLHMSNAALEAARNGSALDTGSEADGSSKKSTPQNEVGPR